MLQNRQPMNKPQVRSIYSLALWGCFVALLAVLISGAVVILDPNVRTFGQAEPPSAPGTIRTREEGDAIERRARENMRHAEEYTRSGQSKRETSSDFRIAFGVTAPLLLLLAWPLLRIRRGLQAISLALPVLVVGALVFGV
jgi:hypothetical protein